MFDQIKQFLPDRFSLVTAWRDARSRKRSLMLYSSGIVAGVAALVAILSFHNDVQLTVDQQAKSLLGADLEVESEQPFDENLTAIMDSVSEGIASSVEFSSMVLYGSNQEPRLSQVRAFEGPFPFYGELKTLPAGFERLYQQENMALVDQSIMTQLDLAVGDSIRVGAETLPIGAAVLEVPGESSIFSLIGPRVFIPLSVVEGSSLLDRGSQVEYKVFLQFSPDSDADALTDRIRPIARENNARLTTVESRKEQFSSIVDNLGRFLGIIAFVALLLGGLGVASSVYIYIKRNSATVATLKCLGVSSRQTSAIFTIQLVAIGASGALTGALAGVVIQQYLPGLFSDFLPFEIVQSISPAAILTGLLTGILVSFGFSLLPLASINRIPPLLTLRNVDFSPLSALPFKSKAAGLLLGTIIVTLTLAWLLQDMLAAFLFTLGIIAALLLLLGVSVLLINGLRALRLRQFSYTWRQGVSNLFRPNNQTAVLITTLGMGMLLIGILYISQDALLQRIDFQTGDQQPNLVFYDIQTDQNDDILEIASQLNVTVLENVPIVSMRLSHRNGTQVSEVREDSSLDVRNWALRREYRVTYRESLTDSEELIEGEWIGQADGIGSVVPISIEESIASDLQVTVGDSLTFDVQGVPVRTRIASVRQVDFQRPQPNFFVLFPAGVLEQAPKFYATLFRTDGDQASATLQQQVVLRHPNVSAIDIGLVLDSVRQFLDKIALAIQFMALFSIATGLIVLASAIAISRFQRIREAVLLRTLGAQRRQIITIQLIEYLLLGLLGTLSGLLLSMVFGWLLVWLFFDLPYLPDSGALFASTAIIILLTLLIGWQNMRGVLSKKPLEILRINSG